jgi:4-amino-4-deoxy-L-arabinose transferase-like glycosyltransferase
MKDNNCNVQAGPRPKDMASVKRDLIVITAIAFVVRLVWARWDTWVGGDSRDYLLLAKNIASHAVFSLSTSQDALIPTASRAPLYPVLIGALWWGDSAPLSTVFFLQAVLGSLTVLLVYLIARDYLSRTVALISALGMAVGPLSCHYTGTVLTETLFTFLMTSAVIFWGRKRFWWAGSILGLAALTRPTISPFLILLLALPLLPAWRHCWRPYLIIFLMALAVSSIWTVRNAIVFRRFIPGTSSGYGTNLIFGAISTKFVGDDVWTAALSDPAIRTDPGLSETENDRMLVRRALSRIFSDPLGWLVVRARQYPRLFLDSGDYLLGSRNVTIGVALRERRALVIFTKMAFIAASVLFVVFAALGLFVERARFVVLSHITLFPVFLTLVHLPIWIELRYSLPMTPLLAILAASGLVAAIKAVKLMALKRSVVFERDESWAPLP